MSYESIIIPFYEREVYMRKVVLRMNEQYKYEVIKKLVEEKENKKRAAEKLQCSSRTINRLIILYNEKGKAGFIHGNRNRKPSCTFDDDTRQTVIDLYLTKYSDANIKHFCELLEKHENIIVSDTTVRNWLYKEGILSPKATRKTKKKLKNKLKKAKEEATTIKEKRELDDKLESLEREDAHPRRSRAAYFGELIQMDASPHVWFSNVVTHLHLAIDDATGKIVGAYFDEQETLNAYYHVLYQILTEYGIPYKFLTDRRTVFEYKRKNASSDEEDTYTQFSYACKQLGIELESSSVPQAKGRVERLNQTLQSRLVVEMRLAGVSTIEEANEFLNSYIKEFNDRFALPINSTKTVFETQPDIKVINQTLAVLAERKIDTGHCIKFENKYYIPVTQNNVDVYLNKGMTALVIKSFDNQLYVNILDQLFALREIPQRLEKSKNFDDVKEPKLHKIYIPPMSHPWKHASFMAFVNKQRHRQQLNQ